MSQKEFKIWKNRGFQAREQLSDDSNNLIVCPETNQQDFLFDIKTDSFKDAQDIKKEQQSNDNH